MIRVAHERHGGSNRVEAQVICAGADCDSVGRKHYWAGHCSPRRVELAAHQAAALDALEHGYIYMDRAWWCHRCAELLPCAPESREAVAC